MESVHHRARKASITQKRILPLFLLLTLIGILFVYYSASDALLSSISIVRPSQNSNDKTSSQYDTAPSNILLVSAFFPSPTSKHTQAEYNKSLSQFLSRITTDTVIFTSLEFEGQIKEIRGDLPIWIDTTFQSPLEIPPLADFQDQYHNMRRHRGAPPTGSPHTFAMRTAKIYFLKQALDDVQGNSAPADKKYKYAFWINFDSFPENHVFKAWPDPFRVEKVWNDGAELSGRAEEDLIFMPLKGLPNPSMSMWTEGMGPVENQISQSTFFGGMANAVNWLHDAYFAYHNDWLRNGRFVGNDDAIFNAIIFLHPSRVLGLWFSDPFASKAMAILSSTQFSSYTPQDPPPKEMLLTPLGQCHNYASYHIFFLSRDMERNQMARLWLNKWRWMWPWQWIRQVMVKKTPCSLTQVLPMLPTLSNRAFNGNWLPPSSDIYPEDE